MWWLVRAGVEVLLLKDVFVMTIIYTGCVAVHTMRGLNVIRT